jgi:hypothetical protein
MNIIMRDRCFREISERGQLAQRCALFGVARQCLAAVLATSEDACDCHCVSVLLRGG